MAYGEEEELVITNITPSLICPVTLRMFAEPVVAPCGHSFEKSAILELLATHERNPNRRALLLPCPTIGCSQSIKESELEEDKILKRKLH